MTPLIPWGQSWETFRTDVFQLVAWGYQLAEAEIRQHHLEEHITGLLRKAIREKLEDMTLPPHFETYSAANEDPEDDDNVFGKDRPVVDIMIESGKRRRQRYRLEAKRCATQVNPIGWYAQGIYPYLDRRYAKEAPEAGLIGLVQSSTLAYWRAQPTT